MSICILGLPNPLKGLKVKGDVKNANRGAFSPTICLGASKCQGHEPPKKKKKSLRNCFKLEETRKKRPLKSTV